MRRYRYQFPIRLHILRDRHDEIGIGISLRKPIIRTRPDDDGSISIFLSILEDSD